MLAKKIALGFGIAVILPMLIHYGVSTFSPAPKEEDGNKCYACEKYKDATPAEKAKIDKENEERERIFKQKETVFQKHLFFVAVPVA